jgi:ubiquinone/menaquinone biosynthesis C-methylase UbiE
VNTKEMSSNTIDSYNIVALKYAEKFLKELDHKPFDQAYLKHFYEVNQFHGKFLDLGCGPGQTTKFLYDCGCRNLTGIDLSSGMIEIAQKEFPQIEFLVGDILSLPYDDCGIGSIIAFYSIVNFTLEQVEKAFQEIYRVLKANGQFFFSFHIPPQAQEQQQPPALSTHESNQSNEIHLEEFLEEKVDMLFYFFEMNTIIKLLQSLHFTIIDVIIRYPYPQEHPTQRAYIIAQKSQPTK